MDDPWHRRHSVVVAIILLALMAAAHRAGRFHSALKRAARRAAGAAN
jgi:hypothetical protein